MPKSARCVQRFDDSRKFCNSHYISRFAAFFIDAGAKRSVAESFVLFSMIYIRHFEFKKRPFSQGKDEVGSPARAPFH